ncbi:FecR family protein [Massilibacteroides vaginae]|uniref:FecR family protein n=1 Tax=Massilibacteroides vaginae TaxID=1673718 RepID=UPI000A1CC7E5|nr:FecR family protein [Massilibacteroides vaginae]
MKIDDIQIDPQWDKSSEDIWLEKFSTLKKGKKKGRKLKLFSYYSAASVILFAVLTSFAYFYSTNEISDRGVHKTVILPDGSKVEMNAESKLAYKPLWWYISRDIELSGEAYFEVEKGSRFSVYSNNNSVHVLGTSFNIFSRTDKYNVTCLAGKVEVISNQEKTILTPNMEAVLNKGKLNVSQISKSEQVIGWRENKFCFIGVPLPDVIEEIERQYDIHVTTTSKLNYLYSGNFSKEKDAQEILDIIGEPFGITFNIKK